MDWVSPLRSLAPTLDGAVLEVLAGTERGLGAGQIARLGGRGTRQGIALAIERLVAHGLVLAHPTNRGHMYTLNRDHILTEPVLMASQARGVLLGRLKAAFESFTPAPLHASLFGSFARHEAGPASDIDVLVIKPPGGSSEDAWYEQLRLLGEQVHVWTGNRMEYLTFTPEGLREVIHSGERIVDEWMSDCVTVYGMSIEFLVGEARATRPATRRRRS
jgi:predicted nucleotidyltransferase